MYVIRVVDGDGRAAYYPMVVTARVPHAIHVILPQMTWQAYNEFGGSSLYTRNQSGELAHRVSFDRPYGGSGGIGYFLNSVGANEIRVAQWLERQGLDLGYDSDVDLDAQPDSIIRPGKAFVFAAHSEYWTYRMFDRVEQFRDSGVHLMFLAGNNAYWNVRVSSDDAGRPMDVVTCFKSSNDPEAAVPSEVTTRFRDPPLNRPENALYGVMYSGQAQSGVTFPLSVPDTISGEEAQEFLGAAGLAGGDSIPGYVSNEGDRAYASPPSPADIQVLFRSRTQVTPAPGDFYDTTFFIAPSGAGVFAGGNNRFAFGLGGFGSPGDPRIEALVRVVLTWMLTH